MKKDAASRLEFESYAGIFKRVTPRYAETSECQDCLVGSLELKGGRTRTLSVMHGLLCGPRGQRIRGCLLRPPHVPLCSVRVLAPMLIWKKKTD